MGPDTTSWETLGGRLPTLGLNTGAHTVPVQVAVNSTTD